MNNYHNANNIDKFYTLDQIINFVNYYNRGAGREINQKTSYDIDQASKNLARLNNTWNGEGLVGKAATITYSFPDWEDMQETAAGDTIIGKFNAQQQKHAESALQAWADIANITFVKVKESVHPNISFGNMEVDEDFSAYAATPYYRPTHEGNKITIYDDRGYDISGQAWFNIKGKNILDPDLGNNGRFTLAHEIGHTLGLSHPGNYNRGVGNPSYKDAIYAEDTQQFSIMSYWKESNTNADYQGAMPSAPLIDDIAAIQYLYGANMQTRTGDTIYGFNSNTERDFYTLTKSDQLAIFAIWDAGGNDTLDLSQYTQDQKINLNSGAFSDAGGSKGNIAIATGVVIENTLGGSGNDMIVGNAANNIIKGGAGSDIIYGGSGQDQLWGGGQKDIFVFAHTNDSPHNAPDKIMDFETNIDRIDLSFFNHGHTVIHVVAELSGLPGEALLSYNAQSNISEIKLDVSGNYQSDFIIQINGKVDINTDIIV